LLCAPGEWCDPCVPPPLPTTARGICVDQHCRVQR
jgi:hypothetical protein